MPGDRPALPVRPCPFVLAVLLIGALSTASVTAAPRASAALAANPPAAPPALNSLESHAEDLVDDALAHDRARVIATADALTASAGAATGRALLAAGVPGKDIAVLRARVAQVARHSHASSYIAIALDANAVSAAVADLYVRFASSVPVAVRRLDTIDRDAQLRSLAGQRALVPAIVARLAATWGPLRQHVIDRGGETVAAAYARHVAAMKRLAPAGGGAFRNEAVNGLNIVDELEAVFSH